MPAQLTRVSPERPSPRVPLTARFAAKAAYREGGRPRWSTIGIGGGRSTVDLRSEAAVRAELAAGVAASTLTRSALLMRVAVRLEHEHGPGVVPIPPKTGGWGGSRFLTDSAPT